MFWQKHWEIPLSIAATAVLIFQSPVTNPFQSKSDSYRSSSGQRYSNGQPAGINALRTTRLPASALKASTTAPLASKRLFRRPPPTSVEYQVKKVSWIAALPSQVPTLTMIEKHQASLERTISPAKASANARRVSTRHRQANILHHSNRGSRRAFQTKRNHLASSRRSKSSTVARAPQLKMSNSFDSASTVVVRRKYSVVAIPHYEYEPIAAQPKRGFASRLSSVLKMPLKAVKKVGNALVGKSE